MLCPNCGAKIEDGDKFCRTCGAVLQAQIQQEPANQYSDISELSDNRSEKNSLHEQHNYERGMKWYNFIVKFQLWLVMLSYLRNGIQWLNGTVYGMNGEAKRVYSYFPAMKMIDKGYGIICLCLILFAIITRVNLVEFNKRGPRYYLSLCVINILLPLIYAVIVSNTMNVHFQDLLASSGANMLLLIVYLILNAIYFNKRKDLFIS